MQAFYLILMHLAAPLLLLRWWWRGRHEPGYRLHLAERLGAALDGPARPGGVWVHAVSVGEAQVAARLIAQLLALAPDLAVTVTTTTPSGRTRLQQLLPQHVRVGYAPLDLPWVVNRFLAREQPLLLVLVETELWPNWLAACARRGIPVALANARLSARARRRYAYLAGFGRRMFERLACVLCSAAPDAERFVALGAAAAAVRVVGNIKFDLPVPSAGGALAALPAGLLVGCSTHAGEDGVLLDSLVTVRASRPTAQLVLAPRHPARAAAVCELARARGLQVLLRSQWQPDGGSFDVLVLDTLGELPALLRHAQVAFVGGTLAAIGGHSPIEAALARVPAVCGPHIFKIEALADQLAAAGALQVCADQAAVRTALVRLYAEPGAHAAAVAGADAVVAVNRGAAQRAAQVCYGLWAG